MDAPETHVLNIHMQLEVYLSTNITEYTSISGRFLFFSGHFFLSPTVQLLSVSLLPPWLLLSLPDLYSPSRLLRRASHGTLVAFQLQSTPNLLNTEWLYCCLGSNILFFGVLLQFSDQQTLICHQFTFFLEDAISLHHMLRGANKIGDLTYGYPTTWVWYGIGTKIHLLVQIQNYSCRCVEGIPNCFNHNPAYECRTIVIVPDLCRYSYKMLSYRAGMKFFSLENLLLETMPTPYMTHHHL